MALLDGDEKLDRQTLNLSGVSNVLEVLMTWVCGVITVGLADGLELNNSEIGVSKKSVNEFCRRIGFREELVALWNGRIDIFSFGTDGCCRRFRGCRWQKRFILVRLVFVGRTANTIFASDVRRPLNGWVGSDSLSPGAGLFPWNLRCG